MKVFISYANTDQWIAKRLSQDLESLGVDTFLDAKDIQTGDSIDESIQKHLKECDDLLILISPASLVSHWVLIEVGGAKALDKRLVPILLHVGANELPQPISKQLARELNEIDKYYDEIKRRVAGAPAPIVVPPRARPRPAPRAFKVGDLVRIPTRAPATFRTRDGFTIEWTGAMDEYFGMVAMVTFVDQDSTVHLDVDEGEYWWAMRWLRAEPGGSSAT